MPTETLFVFLLIVAAATLMASNRVRFDAVALMVLVALMCSGILTPSEALSGFGSKAVILVAGLLVLGEMLERTGVANAIGNEILKRGSANETRILTLVMTGSALLGGIMSPAAVVAIFIPSVLRIGRESQLGVSRLLLPMACTALLGGSLTLIATPRNLVVNEELRNAGYDVFGIFSFTIIGLTIVIVSIAYILLIGRRLLPTAAPTKDTDWESRSLADLWQDYRVDREFRRLRVGTDSPIVNQSVEQSGLRTDYGVYVFGIRHENRREWIADVDGASRILAGDDLFVLGEPANLDRLQTDFAMTRQPRSAMERQRRLWEIGAVAVLIHPESSLIGESLRDVGFRNRYGLHVFGLRRDGRPMEAFEDVELAASDSLLMIGPWRAISRLRTWRYDFVLLETPSEREDVVPAYRKMPVALMILGVMILLSVFNIVPLVAAVIMAALAAVFTRCLSMEECYRAIPWSNLVLVAGMLPLASALEKTGGSQIIVDVLTGIAAPSPYIMFTIIFGLTAALGLVLPNIATAVLVAPVAISTAQAIGASPYPFAIAVLTAASASFVTPYSTPAMTLVLEPGRYRFSDYLKLGLPLLILTFLVNLVMTPVVFPFDP